MTGSGGTYRPLADRLRPQTLDEYVGQPHLLGAGAPLRRALESGRPHSMILWGPPGTGKTTLAQVIAHSTKSHFETISAVLAGVAELRRVIGEYGAGGMLVRAEAEVRATEEVFQPLPLANMALTRRVKAAFDPFGILNAGRMYEGV